MLSNLDTICGTESLIKELSIFDAVFSVILTLVTIPLNSLVLKAIFKFRHLLHRSFYLVIANIILSDLLGSCITNLLSVSFHIKEGLGQHQQTFEIEALHYTFFLTNGVSVFSMAILSMDRLGVLLNPFLYYNIMTKMKMIILLALTWILSGLLAILYFKFGYIRYLAIFSLSTVVLTTTVMVITMSLFHRRLRQSKKDELGVDNPTGPTELNTSSVKEKHQRRTLHNFTKMDRRITTTFLWMLVLFVLNYIPAVIIITYMNLCVNCSCRFIHIMRDIVFLSILSSGMFRALNFVVRLTALQEAVKTVLTTLFRRNENTEDYEFTYTNQ